MILKFPKKKSECLIIASQGDKKNSARMETVLSKMEILPTDCYCQIEISSAAEDKVVCFVNDDVLQAWKDQVAKWSPPGRVQLCTDIRNAFIKKYQLDQEPPQELNSPTSDSQSPAAGASVKTITEAKSSATSVLSTFNQEATFTEKPSSFKMRFLPFEFIPPYPDLRPKFVDYYPMTEEGMMKTRSTILQEQKEKNGILSKFLANSVWSEKMNEALLLRKSILTDVQATQLLENVSAQMKARSTTSTKLKTKK